MGSVVISVEVGSGWGHHPDGDGASDERYRETLSAWRRASYIFDRHKVPATWLVAGHLVAPVDGLDPPDVRDGSAANDRQGSRSGPEEPDSSPCVHPPANPSWSPRDSRAGREQSVRSGPDLVEAIRRSRVAHEIGCRPYSTLDFTDASQEEAVGVVRSTIDAAAELGLDTDQLRAFAFPGGRPGHRDVLVAYGFACYPGPGPRTDGRLSSIRTLLWLAGRRLARMGPPVVEPGTDDHGLVAIPTSTSLFPLRGRARAAARAGRVDPVAGLAKRGVERAAGADGVLHLSLALADLRTGTDLERLEAVLSHVAEYREERGLAVETMGEVARRLGDRAATTPAPVR